MTGDDLRAHLHGIADQSGGYLTPQLVVDAARPKASPLHDAVFDRGVREAADEYYLDRARRLIRLARVKYTLPDQTQASVPEWVSVPTNRSPQRVYRRTEDVAKDPMATAILLRDAEREWRALKARYEHLAGFVAFIRQDLDGMAA